MASFDPKQVSVLINGVPIDDWSDGADVIQAEYNADAGALTVGANGTSIFVASADDSGQVTLKIKQHSPNSKYLNALRVQQQSNLKTFTPLELNIRDLLNDDVVTASKGYFTTRPKYTRGAGHNPTEWVMVFETLNMNLEKGIWN
ncbi:phage structural protein [Paraburkholderia sp. MM5477-R1]|uniref:phage structural protein n=1 Tax=Paraburkholderia sp. MM5477-R1 TaxID=2991062 RepID=UPI003D25F4C6